MLNLRKPLYSISVCAIYMFCLQIGRAQGNETEWFDKISISTNGLLKWGVFYKGKEVKGQVEQFRWNKWITISSFQSSTITQTKGESLFKDSAKVALSTGVNKFRIEITAPVPLISTDIVLNIGIPASLDSTSNWKLSKELEIGYQTTYFVYDEKGNTMLKGEGKVVDVSGLKRGIYYLKTEKEIKEFLKI